MYFLIFPLMIAGMIIQTVATPIIGGAIVISESFNKEKNEQTKKEQNKQELYSPEEREKFNRRCVCFGIIIFTCTILYIAF